MDQGSLVNDAIEFTKKALVGNWKTWLVFIICSLPFSLIRFVFDPEKIIDKTTIHWELIPWTQIILLVGIGFLLTFILMGYLVRVYRGDAEPPVFDKWVSLYIDGIKVSIVSFCWFVPAILAFVVMLGAIIVGAMSSTGSNMAFLGAALIMGIVGTILLIFAALYSTLGAVRFARTGSMGEGINFSGVSDTIRTMGWGSYIIALVVLLVVCIVFGIIVGLLALIPFIGWVIALVLNPLLSVFSGRFITLVYNHGVPQAPPS